MIIGRPTAKQEKDWLARVTRYGEEHGEFPTQDFMAFDRHHVKGREFKHNKVAVGRWYVLPISKHYHEINNNVFNVSSYPKTYEAEFGKQRDQFIAMCAVIRSEDGYLPFIDEVLHAIGDL